MLRRAALLLVALGATGCSLDFDAIPRADDVPPGEDAGDMRRDAGTMPPPPNRCMGCNPLDEGTCGPGETCRIRFPERGVACEAEGMSGVNERCFFHAECGPGLACVGFPDAERCVRVCDPGSFCEGVGRCVAPLVGAPGSEGPACVGFCGVGCDPGTSDGCESGEVCELLPPGFDGNPESITLCRRAGPVREGDPCGFEEDCERGTVCLPDELGSDTRCRDLCSEGDECSSGWECVPYAQYMGVAYGGCYEFMP